MSKNMQIAIVLDCSNIMGGYVDRFKKEIGGILTMIQKQRNGNVTVALINYTRAEDKTKIQQINFTDNLNKIPQLIPSKHDTAFEPKSLKPTDIHTALGNAINDLNWSTKSSRSILILVGINPPHGIKYHKLGSKCDKYPNGTLYVDNKDILSGLGVNKIHLYMISIEQAFSQFMGVLSKIDCMESNMKYVHYIDVNNENELIEEIEKIAITAKRNGKKHEEAEERKTTITERAETDLGTETKETDPDVAVGEMKWICDDKWYPILILSVQAKTVKAWNGQKELTVPIQRLKDRNYDEHANEAMPIFHKLLQSSLNKKKLCTMREKESQEILKNISSSLQFDSDVKWLKYDRSWYPVLIVQTSPKIFVLDIDNIFREVNQHELRSEPPYKTTLHIATHVKRLNDLCSNYSWKSPIDAQCCWKDGTDWWGRDNIRTGVITSIQYAWRNDTRYIVRPDDDPYRPIQISTTNEKFEILDASGYKATIKMKNMKQRLKSIEDDNKKLKSKLEREQMQQNQLHNEVRNVKRERNVLRNDINQHKKRLKSVQDENDYLVSRINKNKRDMESKAKELEEIQVECSKAITMKQGAERQFKTILSNYDELKLDAEILRKQKKEQQQLVNKLRDKKIENSSALDLSRGFPPVQDIVRDFGVVKSEYRVEAAKLVKKILKKKNQYFPKLRNYKIASNMLFDILMDSFEEMKKFKTEQHHKMSNGHEIDDVIKKKLIEKKIKGMYVSILNEVRKEKAQKIVKRHKKKQELDEYLDDDNILLKYAEECISICWVIILVGDPSLTIEPQIFDQSKDGIEFDERLHIEGFGSDTEHCLNFVIWPSIIRKDTDHNISKTTAVFIENIPEWNKKYFKKLKQEKKKNQIEQKEANNMINEIDGETKKKNEIKIEQKNKDNMTNEIDHETAETIVEKEKHYAPDECANDVDNGGAFNRMNDIEKNTENMTDNTNGKNNEFVVSV